MPEDLTRAIEARAWYPVAGICLWYLLRAWKLYLADKVLPRTPDGWRWLPPLLIAAATGFVDGYLRDEPFTVTLALAVFAAVSMGLPAMGVQGAAKEARTLVLVALLAFLPATVGCAHDGKGASSATERTAALAYTGAVVALEVLDAREAAYLDSIAQPTPEQLEAAEARVERLKRARDALALVRDWLTGRTDKNATAQLGDAAKALRLVVEELRADGVRIPASVLDGIQLAELFAGVAS